MRKNIKMLKIVLIVIMISVFTLNINFIFESKKNIVSRKVFSSSNNELTDEQKAIQEVAYAYYRKGANFQYSSERKSYFFTPEDATSQNVDYLVCSAFTYSVYYQALGIELPVVTRALTSYAYNHQGQDDVILSLYGSDFTDKVSSDTARSSFVSSLLNDYNLQVGDVIVWFSDTNASGHALLVYDIVYDDNGNPTDAKILNSTSNFDTTTSKLTERGLSYHNVLNSDTNIYEGTVQMTTLTKAVYTSRKQEYFSVLRPILTNGNSVTGYYYKTTCSGSSNVSGTTCSDGVLTSYSITDASKSRLTYSGIEIEKTVDKFNNSMINRNDELTYTIKITNNSSNTYSSLQVSETISGDITITDTGNGNLSGKTINWVVNVPSNSTKTITYKVKVNNDANYGDSITSHGYVANIDSGTVTNYVYKNLTTNQENLIKEAYTSLKSVYTGVDLINKIYSEALDYDLKLDSLDLDDLVKTTNSGSYTTTSISLNNDNSFSNILLKNYYGAVYTSTSSGAHLKYWEKYNEALLESRNNRNTTIYQENFETGDILIYENEQEETEYISKESGEYVLIFIDDAFYGVDNDGNTITYSIEPTSPKGNDNLQTILAKDKYVILRPSLLVADDTSNTNNITIVNPNTGNNFYSIISVLVIGIISISIYMILRKKKYIINSNN